VIGLKRRNIQTKTGGKFCERLGETREICGNIMQFVNGLPVRHKIVSQCVAKPLIYSVASFLPTAALRILRLHDYAHCLSLDSVQSKAPAMLTPEGICSILPP
jgi:hypothetical protein